MLKASEVTAAVVAKFRAVPELVEALGSFERIYAYTEEFPYETNREAAVRAMPAGSVLVVWSGLIAGRQNWEHLIDIYIRPSERATSETIAGYLLDGTATGDPLRLYDMPLHASCLPLVHRSLAPLPVAIAENATVEFWNWSFTLPEIGG